MCKLFLEGGWLQMSILTLLLIYMLFTAWKTPRKVKSVGALALAVGVFFQISSLFRALAFIQQVGDISFGLFAGGFRISLITILYGLLIYILALIIHIILKSDE